MKQLITAVAAALTLAACADIPTPVEAPTGGPAAVKYYHPQQTIFTTQTPAETLDATGGWEVGTRFTTTREGLLSGFRYWKALGETGTHTVKLWTTSGSQIWSAGFLYEGTSGWQQTYSKISMVLPPGTYIASVNTNTKQVKTFGFFNSGPIVRTHLTADAGAYGQPVGSFPSTITGSAFFVDVNFTPVRCDTEVDSPCP